MSAARTERLLNLLTFLLNTRRPVSLREIREMDEFSAYQTADPKSGERAFERDKAALLELGIPLRWIAPEEEDDGDTEGRGGYVIDRDRYYLQDLRLSPSDLALLSIAGAAAAGMEQFPGRAAIIRALAKLGFDVDEEAPAPGMAHAPVASSCDPQLLGRNLEALHSAVAARCPVDISYRRLNGEASQRRVNPYGLYYRQGMWYLVAYCQLRQAERTFHLGRMESAQECTGAKDKTPYEIPEDFDLSTHAARRPWEFPNGPPEWVTVRLAERLVPAVRELFGGRAEVERKPGDTHALVRIQVLHRPALIQAVLPFGRPAKCLHRKTCGKKSVGSIESCCSAMEYGRTPHECCR